MVGFSAYLITGIRISRRMLRQRKDATTFGLALYRSATYTPEGQRLLRTFLRGWVMGVPVVMVCGALVTGLLCRLLQ